MVIQYHRIPLEKREERALRTFILDLKDDLLVMFGAKQTQRGPERPPGILPQALPPGIPVGPAGLLSN
jgi:hypothetical protein